jgi:tetratricopeptide (TPR) repeat protein
VVLTLACATTQPSSRPPAPTPCEYLHFGEAALAAGALDNAEKYLLVAAQHGPCAPKAELRLARLALARGELDKAECLCRASIAKWSHDDEALEVLGEVHRRQGRIRDAEGDFVGCASREPCSTALREMRPELLLDDLMRDVSAHKNEKPEPGPSCIRKGQ